MNESVDSWLKSTLDQDASERADAADMIPNANDPRVLSRLIELLKDSDSLVRTCAADSLGHFESGSATDELIEALQLEQNDVAQAHIAGTLGVLSKLSEFGTVLQASLSLPARARLHCHIGLLGSLQKQLWKDLRVELAEGGGNASVALDGILYLIEILEDLAMEARNELERLRHSKDTLLSNMSSEILSKLGEKQKPGSD